MFDTIGEAHKKENIVHLDSEMFIEKRKLLTNPSIPIELTIEDFKTRLTPDQKNQITIQYSFLLGNNFLYVFRRKNKDSQPGEGIQLCRFEVDEKGNIVDYISDNIDVLIAELFHKLDSLDLVKRGKSKFKVPEYTDEIKYKARKSMEFASSAQKINQAIMKLLNLKKGVKRKDLDFSNIIDGKEAVEKGEYKIIYLKDDIRYLILDQITNEICLIFWNKQTKTTAALLINQTMKDVSGEIKKIHSQLGSNRDIQVNMIGGRAINPVNFQINQNLKKFMYKPLNLVQQTLDELGLLDIKYDIFVCHGNSCDVKNIAIDKESGEIFNLKNYIK